MRKEYDFSESKPNPYARKLKRQVTISIDADALACAAKAFRKVTRKPSGDIHTWDYGP